MNKANILAVADAIEQHSIPDLGFNMGYFVSSPGEFPDLSGHGCGTTACIGGWAIHLMHGANMIKRGYVPESEIMEWLGIDRGEANDMFYAENHPLRKVGGAGWFERITADQAVNLLRNFADTGKVDWSITLADAA